MPPIFPIPIIGNLKFLSYMKMLPRDWKQPQGEKLKMYLDAFEKHEYVWAPALQPPWFIPHSPIKYHVDSVDKAGSDFKKVHDTMVAAVAFSHLMWKLQAKFADITVMAISAIGSPGCLKGPELESNIKNFPECVQWDGNLGLYRDAVAAGVSKAFKSWQDQVMVPGLPWYPAFAAFPGPQAPPMPNIPTPLIACVSSKASDIMTPDTMKQNMIDALDSDLKAADTDEQHVALFDAIACTLALAFTMWLPAQQVMMVLGKGPIPTFAPPYVPVGPVVGGDIISVPGHLIA